MPRQRFLPCRQPTLKGKAVAGACPLQGCRRAVCVAARATRVGATPEASFRAVLDRYITADLLQRSDHRSVQALEGNIRALDSGVEREPEALYLDQDRRPDTRQARETSESNYWRRTLEE